MVLLSQEDLSDWSVPVNYERHRPETTLLYQIIQEHWPHFQAELENRAKSLPHFVTQEVEEYLKCGRLEHGFLRVRCESCHHEKLDSASPPIRHPASSHEQSACNCSPGGAAEVIGNYLIKRAGLTVKSGAQTGAVTLIQRFGSALNLNRDAAPLHYHMLYLDGVYNKHAVFYPAKPLTAQDLDKVTQKIAERVSRYLEKAGYLVRDASAAPPNPSRWSSTRSLSRNLRITALDCIEYGHRRKENHSIL